MANSALTIRADKLSVDSRYAKIMEVMRSSEQYRPNIRRLGDQLGALYTPLAVLIAIIAWAVQWRCRPFSLAVLVVATPCPLLIGIPVHDYQLNIVGGAARNHHQKSGYLGNYRHVSDSHFRQDRYPHLWPPHTDRIDPK